MGRGDSGDSPFPSLSALLEGTTVCGPLGRFSGPACPAVPGGAVLWGLVPREPGTCQPPPRLSPQVGYYSEMQKIFGDLTQQLDQPGHPDELRERENEARLSELRALSIVADD